MNNKVCTTKCNTYDVSVITEIIEKHFEEIGINRETVKDKKIAIKPNLVAAKAPEKGATTNPAVVEAVYSVLKKLGAEHIILAESPGGPYNAVTFGHICKTAGMTEMAERCGLEINSDFSFRKMRFEGGKKLKEFDIITPIAESDIIVNICKLKTHSLTGFSCAVKNLFGVIPGIKKFEMHAAYPDINSFSEMLVDLNLTLNSRKTVISVCDAIVSMEGNGPTGGTPVETGYILSSDNQFSLDIVGENMAGLKGETEYLNIGAERLGIDRTSTEEYRFESRPSGLQKPDSRSGMMLKSIGTMFGGKAARLLEPKPKISDRCKGCGKCVEYCPQNTIKLVNKAGKKVAKINPKSCIRCYCCQELCPFVAVDTVTNPIVRWIH